MIASVGSNAPPFASYTNDRAAADWSRMGLAIRLTMATFMQHGPDQVRRKGLTEGTCESEATKRISELVRHYYSVIQVQSTARSLIKEDEASNVRCEMPQGAIIKICLYETRHTTPPACDPVVIGSEYVSLRFSTAAWRKDIAHFLDR